VAVYDAEVEISSSGAPARTIKAKAGDVVWQAAGTNHSIRNVGATDFVAIEIEIR